VAVLWNPNGTGGPNAAIATGTVRATVLAPTPQADWALYRRGYPVPVVEPAINEAVVLDTRYDDAGTTQWEGPYVSPP